MDKINAPIVTRTDVKTSLTPAFTFPSLRIEYPDVVIRALATLYEEYNQAFLPLVKANCEWGTDYQYCFLNNSPVNWIVQIDMQGLSDETLYELTQKPVAETREFLRGKIFEIENSWALYQLLDRVCDRENGEISWYGRKTRDLLDGIRRKFNRPIALLGVTHEKYVAMRETEFGKFNNEPLSDSDIFELSGFNKFLGPGEFQQHLQNNGGQCRYLLYCRASDPVSKLKKPSTPVEHPLLSDPKIRQTIKANCLTFNVDDPAWPTGDPRRINDTKWYMPSIGMAVPVRSENDLGTAGFSGDQLLRAKPAQGTYGCYGHERGKISDGEFRRRVRYGIRDRGPYLIQPEHPAPTIFNEADGIEYAYIDRVFYGTVDGYRQWLGGFREFLPSSRQEAKSGRLHGNKDTVFAEIF